MGRTQASTKRGRRKIQKKIEDDDENEDEDELMRPVCWPHAASL